MIVDNTNKQKREVKEMNQNKNTETKGYTPTMEEYLTLGKFYSRTKLEYKRFNHCQAYVSEHILNSAFGVNFKLIRSYETIVGLVDLDRKVMIEFGKWSQTTSKQFTQIHNQLFRDTERKFVDVDYETRERLRVR